MTNHDKLTGIVTAILVAFTLTTQAQTSDQVFRQKMEDYGILPPIEDFRRTIFWAPNIYTDKEGKAQVEFWNNSSCKEMHISCEGITGDGRILINE